MKGLLSGRGPAGEDHLCAAAAPSLGPVGVSVAGLGR